MNNDKKSINLYSLGIVDLEVVDDKSGIFDGNICELASSLFECEDPFPAENWNTDDEKQIQNGVDNESSINSSDSSNSDVDGGNQLTDLANNSVNDSWFKNSLLDQKVSDKVRNDWNKSADFQYLQNDLPQDTKSLVNSFKFTDEILKIIASHNWVSPTVIQRIAIPVILKTNKAVFIDSFTGSGKTGVFALSIIGLLTNQRKPSDKSLYALVISPTRELCSQIVNEFNRFIQRTNIRLAALFGGLSIEKQKRFLNKNPHIIIATIGRLFEVYNSVPEDNDLTVNYNLKSNLKKVTILVVDEIDKVITSSSYKRLTAVLKDGLKKARVIATSATLLTSLRSMISENEQSYANISSEELPNRLAQQFGKLVHISTGNLTLVAVKASLKQSKNHARGNFCDYIKCYLSVYSHRKKLVAFYSYCFKLINDKPAEGLKIIVFTLSKDFSGLLFRLSSMVLAKTNMNIQCISSIKQQKNRFEAIEEFQKARCALLITTDVAAHGIDFDNVNCCIQMQPPLQSITIIHRHGRIARQAIREACKNGNEQTSSQLGSFVTIASTEEEKTYRKLFTEVGLTNKLNELSIDLNMNKLDIISELVQVASTLESNDFKLSKLNKDVSSFAKLAKEAEMDFDPLDLLSKKQKRKMSEKPVLEADNARLKKQLNQLISKINITYNIVM